MVLMGFYIDPTVQINKCERNLDGDILTEFLVRFWKS